jgi:arabinogalactan oligomer / maltooligosaccharide transport system substrate-binding protein
MQILSSRTARLVAFASLTLFAVLVVAGTVSAANKATNTLTIWTDADRKAAVDKIASAWGTARGVNVVVVQKDFGKIRDDLGTVQADSAPDVIVGAHDWTGALAANGLVVPLNPSRTIRAQFPQYTLDAFSYGTAVKRLYGAPVAVENIGLVVNTQLAKVPTTWAQLEASALAFKKKKSGNLAIAVQQGAAGDAYHMYPFFSGLCGYVFGKNRAGNLDPSDIGVANPKFLKNATAIDRWNRLGLLNAKVDDSAASTAFLGKKAAFWVTGPWNSDRISKAGIKFKVVQVPAINCKSVPFLGVQGFMVTKFAAAHGVDSAAKDLVTNFMATPSAQTQLAAANGRPPANIKAKVGSTDTVLAQFRIASKGGVPMPNIPRWTRSGRTSARRGFARRRAAAR